MLGYHRLKRSRVDIMYTENLACARTGGVHGGCTAETIILHFLYPVYVIIAMMLLMLKPYSKS